MDANSKNLNNTIKPDNVNHPAHYQTSSGLETIDVIEAFTEGLTGFEATNTGNVIKYICRWKNKNGLEDLKKARWYLNRLISTLEAGDTDGDQISLFNDKSTQISSKDYNNKGDWK